MYLYFVLVSAAKMLSVTLAIEFSEDLHNDAKRLTAELSEDQ